MVSSCKAAILVMPLPYIWNWKKKKKKKANKWNEDQSCVLQYHCYIFEKTKMKIRFFFKEIFNSKKYFFYILKITYNITTKKKKKKRNFFKFTSIIGKSWEALKTGEKVCLLKMDGEKVLRSGYRNLRE